MEFLDIRKLQERTREIACNLTVFDNIGKDAVMDVKGPTQTWWVLWAHCLEEMVLRKYSYPEGFESKSEFEDRFLCPRLRIVNGQLKLLIETILKRI